MRSRSRLAQGALVCATTYLYGSIPFVHWLVMALGTDLKRFGSGNVGASNLFSAAGGGWGALGWLLDTSKGVVPVLLARSLGVTDVAVQMGAVCGVAGQCWPWTLRFQGGRGVSAYVGATLALAPRLWPAALAPLVGTALWRVAPLLRHGGVKDQLRGDRSKSVPLGTFFSVLSYLLASLLFGGPKLAAAWLAAVIWLRRLTAPQPDDAEAGPARRREALRYRLLYDRNTAA
jgi:hypothetical protein